MNKKVIKQMAKMVDAVQPSCDEKISAAMTCSHAGSMGSLLTSTLMSGLGAGAKSSDLPNPVFIAVGEKTIYAFDFAPRGFKYKIKKEAARWPKDQITVQSEMSRGMAKLSLTTKSGDVYPLEIPTMMGGKELVEMFLEALGVSQV
jgi:hypothetical protein